MHTQRNRDGGPDLAAIAAALADRTRASFCLALLDGRAWTASELAAYAGVAASSASEHLTVLVSRGLLTECRQGRHRYVTIADARVAEAIEGLAALADGRTEPPRTLSADTRQKALGRARTCYDHLAGALGVSVTDGLTRLGHLDWSAGLALTGSGRDWVDHMGLVLDGSARRPLVRSCLDWTERRPHLAGALGAAIASHALSSNWVVRIPKSRALRVTPGGLEALAQSCGMDKSGMQAVVA